MKLWQQISVLSLGCALAATAHAGVIVDRTETGSVSVHVDGNETNTVQSEKASKLSLKSTRSKVSDSEKIEVEVEGEKTVYDDYTKSKKDKVQLNAVGNNQVQVAVGSSETETTETSTVDVNAAGGAKVDVALDSDNSETVQTNFVEVNAIGSGEEGTFVEIENNRRESSGWWWGGGELEDELSLVLSGRIGLDVADVGKDQHIQTSPGLPDQYKYDNKWDSALVWGLFGGVEIPLRYVYSWQTGFAYYSTNDIDTSGQIYPQSDLAKDDKDFSYSMSSQRFMWENKLFAALNQRFSIYAVGGIGLAVNKASNYKEKIRDPITLPGPSFVNKTTNSFTWLVGAGVEMDIVEDFSVGIGYQFADLGKVQLGQSHDGQTISDQTLESTSTPTNEVILALTYLFN